ncbi:metal-dependent phosphohydrolase, partial [Escherichia coli]|nr:metal-dependent phosphohydrolase [Escherichia coli]
IPLFARVALLAQVVDVFHTAAGPAAAIAEVRARSGTWFDPQVVACFEKIASELGFWDTLASEEVEEAVVALAPASPIVVDEDYLDDIARAF